MAHDLLAWSVAWERAAFGPDGFYRYHHPGDHFATDVTDGSAVAERLAHLVEPVLAGLVDGPHPPTVTDVGAADGLLLQQVAGLLDAALADRIDWRAVDLRTRPDELPSRITWVQADARRVDDWMTPGPGVVIAHELLDDIPCDIVELDDDGRRRVVLVQPETGAEVLGPPTTDVAACAAFGVDGPLLDEWCDRWWQRREPAARVEVGRSRDDAWRLLANTVTDGLAVAVDYGHVRTERDDGVWDGGTLAAFRDGRGCSTVADGSANLTAHVAMDSCAAWARDSDSRLERSAEGLWWLVQEMGR